MTRTSRGVTDKELQRQMRLRMPLDRPHYTLVSSFELHERRAASNAGDVQPLRGHERAE